MNQRQRPKTRKPSSVGTCYTFKRDYRSGRKKLSFCNWKKAYTAPEKNDRANFSGKKKDYEAFAVYFENMRKH